MRSTKLEGGNNSPKKADAAAWTAVTAGIVGALMATLDVSITNSALPQIQGEIGTSGSEGTWIVTAYLVAEIVMIPLSGWFTNLLGLRRFLLVMTSLFICFSMVCGLSTSLGMMVAGRVGQGFTGGAMIPTAMTIIAQRLPANQQSIGVALFAITAIMGPIAGPVLGGWLTENASWHYAFFLNLPVGVGLIMLLTLGLPSSRTNLELLLEADWLGIVGLSMFLGCLTVVLEDGQRESWFESSLIVLLTGVALGGFCMLVLGQLTADRPVIRLSILFQRSFGSVVLMAVVTGASLYGITYLIPQFLARISGYNALQSGMVVLISGLPMLAIIPFFPLLIRTLDLRIAIAFGLVCYSVSCYLDTSLTAATNGGDFGFSQLLRGLGQTFTLVFLNQAMTSSVPREQAQDAAGIYTAARNLGGSIGLAVIGLMLDRQTSVHTQRLMERVTANSVIAQERIHQSGSDPQSVQLAIVNIFQVIKREAAVMAFNDMFYFFAIALLVIFPLVFILRPIQRGPAVAMPQH
ncbi:DHA2 family efflux MFS transporter permease subunit [Rhizobium sp. VS19-DR104.2]|uniref:DHA2 family efflux MFS transporter permease subunit n=2 Tax=Rhizobium TaxID=379 RepID=UPI001C5A698F|nr:MULTISPECIES: DHA2 family efflux MFS transporter permease subunit [unclassified Rhizobium]QXZ82094.1 DHA2 family efflux MFS transporter permease subunit [Rhizobium sp. L51/94]MBZ5763723.1 DHA2 family efflux MFS transporter permease subunit [Rhizobium sp. VS19-DR96]MBZ5769650.1 DHA2 family efflux MFS transporter permease subunit [Rhizobium sp. VS19-DR129.2]MBZ5777185.1 DHA2 family efflux MFS transporter permease subunit [Rhizobium sp. VS19-DRK62.2]MBZ5788331.1 DHA2 family efflux MFS transpor